MKEKFENAVVQKVAWEVQEALAGEETGHDWWHVFRVWNTAKYIAKQEQADMFVVELGALLHDIADWKFHGGDDTVGLRITREVLSRCKVPEETIQRVCDIVEGVSFKGAGVDASMKTKEGNVVQDADRLDALGAIGVARAFAYGGKKGRPLYDPSVKPKLHTTKEEYVKSEGTTVNHFYEKLLLLKDLMNTETGREIAQERHKFLQEYLERFFHEWEWGSQ